MNLNDKTKYDGYFCEKCKLIPLIQIIPQESGAKILSACKCHKQYENIETFIKNKSLKDKIDFKYEEAKKDLFESSTKFRNKLIN